MLVKGPRVVNATSARSADREQRWIYGINAVQRRLEVRPSTIRELRVASHSSNRGDAIVRLARSAGIAVGQATAEELHRLTQARAHQGVAALADPIAYRDLDGELLRGTAPVLVLDQIQDPQNLGALLRTAAATGMAAVILPRHGAAPITSAVEKVAAGAVNDVAICRVGNLSDAIRRLREHGFWSAALVAHGGQNLFETDLSARIALVLGGESGLRPLVERHCDYRLTIPVRSGVESLNASVAGAVAMYELVRPRTLTR
jgi:23S rRNA (guanosine2251-2'-O)-methyltransferase